MSKPNEKHRAWIRQLPCAICGDNTSVESAHVRYADANSGKTEMGMGRRDDIFVLPLCGNHHREQHRGNERLFWKGVGLDPLALALALYKVSGDHEAGERIIAEAQR